MTSKERVHRALKRQPVDRVPVFMWFHPQTTERLGNLLEIPAQYVPLAMGDDIRQAWVSNNHAMEGIVHENDGESHTDDWSIEWTRIDVESDGFVADKFIFDHPVHIIIFGWIERIDRIRGASVLACQASTQRTGLGLL